MAQQQVYYFLLLFICFHTTDFFFFWKALVAEVKRLLAEQQALVAQVQAAVVEAGAALEAQKTGASSNVCFMLNYKVWLYLNAYCARAIMKALRECQNARNANETKLAQQKVAVQESTAALIKVKAATDALKQAEAELQAAVDALKAEEEGVLFFE